MLVVGAVIVLSACAAPGGTAEDARDAIPALMITPSGITFSVKDEREVTGAARGAARLSSSNVASRPGSARVSVVEIPFLSLSQPGKEFLARPGPRALAIGDPAASCPVTGLSSPTARDTEQASSQALEGCLAAAEALADDQPCGCKLAALNDIVMLPRAETAYATAVTARLYAPEFNINGIFVAEEVKPSLLILRDLNGIIGQITLSTTGGARLILVEAENSTSKSTLTGKSIPVGYRRGQIARRLYLSDSIGRRASLLIGFSPAELADFAAAWLAFPPDLDRLLAGGDRAPIDG
ncbi:MAG: hypothetical protein AAFS07_12350 [Pseudomonadota bacterium]